VNVCGACGADFSGLTMFDAHRVGKHELDYPAHEDGRRCLTADEMAERGWQPNRRGAWHDPAAAERMRLVFAAR
jgi:hypothetical protein